MGAKLSFSGTDASVISTKVTDELDDLVFASVIDRDLTLPPLDSTLTNGDRYIPAATAIGDWAGQENKIAIWAGTWRFLSPTRNMKAWLEDELLWIEYDGSAWVYERIPGLNVENKTANYTVTAQDVGKVFDNTGAAGTVTFTLPVAILGMHYIFLVNVAQELRIDPAAADQIALPSTGVLGTAGKYLTANAVTERIHLICIAATEWQVLDFAGTWTAEV